MMDTSTQKPTANTLAAKGRLPPLRTLYHSHYEKEDGSTPVSCSPWRSPAPSSCVLSRPLDLQALT